MGDYFLVLQFTLIKCHSTANSRGRMLNDISRLLLQLAAVTVTWATFDEMLEGIGQLRSNPG